MDYINRKFVWLCDFFQFIKLSILYMTGDRGCKFWCNLVPKSIKFANDRAQFRLDNE